MFRTLLNLVYPRSCYICGKESPEALDFLCWDCLADTQKVEPPFCSICGDPVPGNITHQYHCHWCSLQRPHFERARSAFRYDGAIRQLLQDLKYHHHTWLARDLAEMLAHCVRAEYETATFDLICPVPLHISRKRSRGYNQSALLAKELSNQLSIPFFGRAVRRVVPTPSQTNLTATQRDANMRDAFESGTFRCLKNKRILLVDDVMTTGATTNACAGALKKSGALCVHVITVARG
jgi:ComF family protein